jgi:hypothetical protein
VAHLQFFQPHKAKQKTAKEPPSQRTKTDTKCQRTTTTDKKGEVLTAVLQKSGFSG